MSVTRGLLASCMAFAQAAAQTPRDSAVLRALSTFSEGQPIRIALLSARWSGTYLGQRGDTVFLGRRDLPPDVPPMAVRFNAVDTAWRASRHTRRGAVIGGVAGGVLGMVFMGAVAYNLGGENQAPAVAVGAAGGALGGATAGALVGSLFRRWRIVFP